MRSRQKSKLARKFVRATTALIVMTIVIIFFVWGSVLLGNQFEPANTPQKSVLISELTQLITQARVLLNETRISNTGKDIP